MPSTYTVNLGIEKPATGEQSGTWGDTTNVNFDILDQAINGAERVTLTSAGSSGSPNALNITNGATSDGRNKWIEFYSSGDLGGSVYVQLVPNDAEKIVFVRNSLASSRSILLFQGTYNSGRDLEVPAGVDMVVKFDGGGASAATVTDVYTKLRATEITTPTLTAGTADINGGTLDGSVIGGASAAAITGTTVVANTSLNIAGDGATVTGIKDEDNMASNSATKLATQQSIKAYVDSQVGTVDTWAEVLANGATSGSTNPEVTAGQALKTNTINETSAGSGVTIDSVLLKDDVVNATDVETGSISANDGTAAATIANSTGNFTITNFISNSVDIGGGAIDGTVIGGASAAAGSFTTLGASGASSFGADVTITSTDAGTAYGPNFTLRRDSASPADNDFVGRILWQADNDAGENTSYAALHTRLTDVSDGSEDGLVQLDVMVAGTTTNLLDVGASGIVVNDSSVDVDFRVESDGNANMLFVDGGNNRVGVGTTTRANLSSSVGSTAALQVEGLTAANSSASVIRNANSVNGPYLSLGKSRGTGLGGTTIVQSGDQLGVISFLGSDGTDLEIGAQIIGTVNGTPGANDMPGALAFLTTADGAVTPSERMTISSSGAITINGGLTVGTGVVAQDLTLSDNTPTISMTDTDSNADALIFTDGGTGTGALFISADHNDEAAGSYISLKVDSAELAQLKASEVIFNEDSRNQDFRVESDSNTHMLFVDGGTNQVGINRSSFLNSTVRLEVGGADNVPLIAAEASGVRAGIGVSSSKVGFYHDATSVLTIASTGKIETVAQGIIETASSTGSLTLHGGATNKGGTILLRGGNGDSDIIFKSQASTATPQEVARIGPSEMVVNEGSLDYDFRVESNTESHAIFVDAGNDRVGLFSSSPTAGYKVSIGGGALNVIDDNAINRITSTAGYTVSTGGTGNIFRLATLSAHGARARARAIGSVGYGDPVVHEFIIEMAIGNANDEFGVNVYRTGNPLNQHRFKQTNAEFDVYTDKVNDSSFDVWVKMGHFIRLEFFLEEESGTTARFDNSGTATLPGTAVDTNTKSEYIMFADDVRITTQNTAQNDLKQNVNFNFDGVIFNEDSVDLDFRVESDSNSHMLFVDAGNNRLGIGESSPTKTLSVLGDAIIKNTTDGTYLTLHSTQANNASGPDIVLFRDSSSPADDDPLSTIFYQGRNSAGAIKDYMKVRSYIVDVTDGTEDFGMDIQIMTGGNAVNALDILPTEMVINNAGIDRDFRVESDDSTHAIFVDGGQDFFSIGKSTDSVAVRGSAFSNLQAGGHHYLGICNDDSTSTNSAMYINRETADGDLIVFRQANSTEGTISVSGATVSYNGFSGRHESSGIATNTAVGTVVSTIDELDVYPDTQDDPDGGVVANPKAGQTRTDHAKVKVSDTVGDACVYGVVSEFTVQDKVIVTSVGVGSVRVTGACAKGDLLESNGDGTAKVQLDDIIRSKTIGKVTIGNNNTGVKLVSCVMYCG